MQRQLEDIPHVEEISRFVRQTDEEVDIIRLQTEFPSSSISDLLEVVTSCFGAGLVSIRRSKRWREKWPTKTL